MIHRESVTIFCRDIDDGRSRTLTVDGRRAVCDDIGPAFRSGTILTESCVDIVAEGNLHAIRRAARL